MNPTHVGFTGTQRGMTMQQKERLYQRLQLFGLFVAHHGDCIGADATFHAFARQSRASKIIGHIPVDDSRRAFCDFDETRPPQPYLVRNRLIVEAADYMIAAPFQTTAQVRSGTWSTVRLARAQQKPLCILWPDGSFAMERWR
jgi:hypothetical protein